MMRTYTWLFLLVIFTAFDRINNSKNDDSKSELESDMQTVANAVLKFIRKSNGNSNRRNHKHHHKKRNLVNPHGVDVFLSNGSLCLGINEDDGKGNSPLVCFNISNIIQDYIEKNKNKDAPLEKSVDVTRKNINPKHKASAHIIDGDNGAAETGSDLGNYNYDSDHTDVEYFDTDNCGLFGCGRDNSWRTAPEKIWQGVKSGLEDWALRNSSSKARSVAVGRPYSDKIFGAGFF
ncbi:hypothetical protein ILUMI_04504 [Ignelater luminosus]|uniref:Uncharacterized protein n=1 Tax=Ignelater luminosus TaxID=2038154 RepID=A0A8K0DCS9_IGNLU|nr:hypothetical protein ILUMI_04504 [Ignelater luminosus]